MRPLTFFILFAAVVICIFCAVAVSAAPYGPYVDSNNSNLKRYGTAKVSNLNDNASTPSTAITTGTFANTTETSANSIKTAFNSTKTTSSTSTKTTSSTSTKTTSNTTVKTTANATSDAAETASNAGIITKTGGRSIIQTFGQGFNPTWVPEATADAMRKWLIANPGRMPA
ncbi:hypothetical protein BC835DRAFT_1419311 [Cytidiella melzeri]|nr:hypothetical protein BC835DRAFT_1419311 [Cytidiella melzeri]